MHTTTRSLFHVFGFAFLACIALVLSGCATLFSGTDDSVTFSSEPSGAMVLVDGRNVGTTPVTVEIDRPGFGDADVTVQLEGYDTRQFELDKEFNTTAILNIFAPIGFLIDAVTGAIYKLDPTTYTVNMESGIISMNIDELERGEDGQYLVPDVSRTVVVEDAEAGLRLVFE